MALYTYRAKDRVGKMYRGQIEASDKAVAMEELKRRGVIILSLEEKRNTFLNQEFYLGSPVKHVDFVIYCRQFATLIRAGVPIVEANRILAEQTESRALKKALMEITVKLKKGIPFSQAAGEQRFFPPFFINMIRAGEESGKMDETLERIAHYFEKEHDTREKVKSAMTYPVAVGLIAIIVVGFLLKFVVPRFVGMFEQMHAELPAVTRFVLALSQSVERQWYLWLLGMALIVFLFIALKRTAQGAYWFDYLKLKVPVFGKLNQKGAIAQLTRTLASLYGSSVPVLQSLSIVENLVNNRVIGEVLRKARESLSQGRPLSEPLKRSWVFPPLVTQMIAVGEETGSLDQMLEKVADFYERDVENTVDRLKSLIEPLLIVFLAGVVGIIVAAILLPMFTLYQNIGNMQ
ncbi:Type II secretion system protein [[Clostridium] ultunense Esp]|nr:Type II secretion system protein [[Clostridium] ultunense Esp]